MSAGKAYDGLRGEANSYMANLCCRHFRLNQSRTYSTDKWNIESIEIMINYWLMKMCYLMELWLVSGSKLDEFSFKGQLPFGLAEGNDEFQHLAVHGNATEKKACKELIEMWPRERSDADGGKFDSS